MVSYNFCGDEALVPFAENFKLPVSATLGLAC